MPLPTTNCTAHFNASVNTQLWQTSLGVGVVADGDLVRAWDDAESADLSATSSTPPAWRSVTPGMLLPCLDFSGATDKFTLYNDAGVSGKVNSDFGSTSAKSVMIALYVEAASANNAAVYANHCVWGDFGGYWGLYVRTDGAGLYYVQSYNWDGGLTSTELPILLATTYLVTLAHDGATLSLTLNAGVPSTTSSGATASMGGAVQIGENNYNGRIGEIAAYSTSTPTAGAYTYLGPGRWLAGAAAGVAPISLIVRQAVNFASTY